MLETIIELLRDVPWYWVLTVSFLLTFAENIFPPSPSDTALVFIGTLIGIDVVGFTPLLLVSTAGSLFGFVTMYWLGRQFGDLVIDSKKVKFINRDSLEQPDQLFQKYGDYILILNRFLSGTRAVISFFAGISKIPAPKTFLLSGISALLWNAILISLGMFIGENWQVVEYYFDVYMWVWIGIIAVLAIAFWFWRKKRKARKAKLKSISQNNESNEN